MGTVSTTLPSDGSTIDAADVNTPINAILSEFNGNIDNDNIKSAASISGSKLADASITNAKLSTTAGELGGAWADWTPTWTNVSGGTLDYAKYTQIGKTVILRLKYTLGGAGVSGSVVFSLPVTAADNQTGDVAVLGRGSALESGNNVYDLVPVLLTTTTVRLRPVQAGATYATYGAQTSSTIPFTWGTGDTISCYLTYEAA